MRALNHDDIDAYAAMCADEEWGRFLTGALSREDAWRQMAMFAGSWVLRGYGHWAAIEQATGTFLGRCGFWYPEGWPGLEIGWAFDRRHWGRGSATEAADAALDYGFGALGFEHLISVIDPGNARSVAVAERLGETIEGTTQLRGFEVVIYGITRARWESTEGATGKR